MNKRVTLTLDGAAAALLPRLAPSVKRQGEFVSDLIKASAATQATPPGADVETLRLQILGLNTELQAMKARLSALESRRL